MRFAHVFFGALWAGIMFLTTFFVMPSLAEAGPGAAKVSAGLQRRGVLVIAPIFALITLTSGMYLFNRLAGGNTAALMGTPMGLAFVLGAVSSLIAFLLGIIVMRPAMVKAQQLAQSGGPAPEIQCLQRRGAVVGRIVAILLLFTLGAMAVARYL
jgi:uncharacterized membrane protein